MTGRAFGDGIVRELLALFKPFATAFALILIDWHRFINLLTDSGMTAVETNIITIRRACQPTRDDVMAAMRRERKMSPTTFCRSTTGTL